MEKLNYIIEEQFKSFDIDDELKNNVKQSFKDRLKENNNLKDIDNEESLLSTSIKICLENEIKFLKSLKEYENFRNSYRKKVFRAILFGIIFPLLFTIFVFELEYKLIILIYIICSILISCFYIIVLEYIDYSKKKELDIKD